MLMVRWVDVDSLVVAVPLMVIALLTRGVSFHRLVLARYSHLRAMPCLGWLPWSLAVEGMRGL